MILSAIIHKYNPDFLDLNKKVINLINYIYMYFYLEVIHISLNNDGNVI
jgi:hypothetical protein